MIKAILITVFTVTIVCFKAQTISLGPSVGYGNSWIANFEGDRKSHPHFNAGLSFNYNIKPHFSLSADTKFSSEGGETRWVIYGPADGLISFINSINLDYIRVPVKFSYISGNNKSVIRFK